MLARQLCSGRSALVLVATALLPISSLACSPRPATTPPPTGRAADAPVDQPGLPPGILARAEGTRGRIQVEERDGLRLLTIDGVVHAAMPLAGADLAVDPVVQLVTTVRPRARTALVIGLGSGKTASDFAAAGLTVEAVELEPAVIDFARAYFGYRGHAVAGDGLDFVQRNQQRYDVVLMDAFAGTDPPPHLITGEALATMRQRTTRDGVTVVRGLGAPDDPALKRIARDLAGSPSSERSFAFVHVFGSGVGSEPQNLYFLSSHQPLDFTGAPPLPMWPLIDRHDLPDFAVASGGDGDARAVTLVGYVHTLGEDGALALDLPHWEMGAIRYLLTGDAVAPLRGRLPVGFAYPTQGDIGSDGDPSTTLHEVIGGGGTKRSDVRLSPLIAMVTGTARLRALVHPDSRYIVRDRDPSGHQPAATEPRLPYGGALYDLAVSEVTWSLDRDGWAGLEKQLSPFVTRAGRKLRAGDFEAAVRELAGYLAALEERMPANLPPYTQMKQIATRLEAATGAAGAATDLRRAVICDRAWLEIAIDVASRDVKTLHDGLFACAEDGYRAIAARSRDPLARTAAGRLLWLWDRQLYAIDAPRHTARLQREMARLRQRYPDLQVVADPPPIDFAPSIGDPPADRKP